MEFLCPKFVGGCFISKCSKSTKAGKMRPRLPESALFPLQVHDRDNVPTFVLFSQCCIQNPTWDFFYDMSAKQHSSVHWHSYI